MSPEVSEKDGLTAPVPEADVRHRHVTVVTQSAL